MSSQNTYPGPNAGRPVRPANQERPRQPSWVNPQAQQPAHAPQQPGWPQQQAPQGGFPQQGYGAPAPQQQPSYGQWSELQPSHAAQPQAPAPVDPYAPQFEPYVAPARGGYGHQQQAPQAPQYGAQAAPQQWPGRSPDPRTYDPNNYAAPGQHAAPQPMQRPGHAAPQYGERPYHEADLGPADWPAQPDLGGFGHDPYQQAHSGAELGFAQPEGGELDGTYGEEDEEYELEEAPRGRRPMMIAAALVGAILVGGGMAYGYKKFTSADSQGDPPLIKSEAFPSKTKPADAGGKQFPYSDSKIMGRLGDGTSSASADESNSSGSSSDGSQAASSAPSSEGSTDESGTRKVATLVVGRDGTIQPPPAEPVSDTPPSSQVAVPGTALVDVFGTSKGEDHRPNGTSITSGNDSSSMKARASAADASDEMPAPAKKSTPVKVTKVNSASAKTAMPATSDSMDDSAAPAPPVKKLKKVAKAETTVSDADPDTAAAAPVTSSGGSGGFVAVLASVPKSASSRMDALKRFADMQQKYGAALAGKTPDVAEADLGAKGAYHRLIVGPPGSREQASTVCSALKSEGYANCWVTSY